MTFYPFNYKVRDVICRNQETPAIFTDNPIISFRRNKNIRDNLVCSALRQNLPAPAGTFSCYRGRCYTCSFLNSATSISGPNIEFRYSAQLYIHLLQHHLLHLNVANFTSVKRADVYMTVLLDILVP